MWFTILFFIVIIILWFILEKLGKKSKTEASSQPIKKILDKSSFDFTHYQAKSNFFNSSEKTLYDILSTKLGNKYIILSKVRIEDFMEYDNSSYNNKTSYRNRIKSRHVDFVLLDKNTYKVSHAIELDGNSHNNTSSEATDDFKNNLFQHVGIPLHRIKVGSNFFDEVDSLQL